MSLSNIAKYVFIFIVAMFYHGDYERFFWNNTEW